MSDDEIEIISLRIFRSLDFKMHEMLLEYVSDNVSMEYLIKIIEEVINKLYEKNIRKGA